MADIVFISGDIAVGASWTGGVVPGAADNAIFDATSGDGTGTANFGPVAGWNMTGYTGDLWITGDVEIDVDGDLVIAGEVRGGHVIIGGHTFAVTGNVEVKVGAVWHTNVGLKHNGVAGDKSIQTRGLCENVAFEINNAGIATFTLNEVAGTVVKYASFDRKNNAEYKGGAFDHEIGGYLLIGTGGVITQTGKWSQVASGDVLNTAYANRFTHLVLADGVGVTSTLTGNIRAKKFEFGAGTVTGAFSIFIHPGASNFFVSGSGTVNSAVDVNSAGVYSNGEIQINNALTIMMYVANNVITLTGPISLGAYDLFVRSNVAGAAVVALDMGSQSLACRDVLLGNDDDATKLAEIRGTGVWNIRNLQAGHADHDGNKVTLPSLVNLSGTMLGERNAGKKIIFTNVACQLWGGTVTDCDFSGTNELICFGTTDGGGNTNVVFNPASPGSLALMGAGV